MLWLAEELLAFEEGLCSADFGGITGVHVCYLAVSYALRLR